MRFGLERRRVWSAIGNVGGFIFLIYAVCIGAVVYLLFFDQSWADCDLAVHRSIPSPDGKLSAVVYEMECGATVAFNTQVSIAPADRPFSPKQNPSFLSLHGQHDVAVNWVNDRVLEVDIPQGAEIYRSDRSVGDVAVEYR